MSTQWSLPSDPNSTPTNGPPLGPKVGPPLWAPYYGASIGVACARFWRKYSDFGGRASRSEYWWWVLIIQVMSIPLNLAGIRFQPSLVSIEPYLTFGGAPDFVWNFDSVIATIISLVLFVPTLSLLVRRLHDTDRSAHHLWLLLIPLIGAIVILIYTIQQARPGGERFDRPVRASMG